MVYRTEIERALDELISNEDGMRFQSLAVILAKKNWPDLIACERHNDLGLDAHEPASLAINGIGKGLVCSITPTFSKVNNDAKKAKKNFDDVKVLVFATPQKVTNLKAQNWANKIWNTFGYELIVRSREDFITSLSDPKNVSICRTLLGIPVPTEVAMEELVERVGEATSELAANWLKHPRLTRRPLIPLQAIKPASEKGLPDEVLNLNGIQALLTECRRVVLEAPAGRGKTTTLVQLANLTQDETRLSFLIDMREWAESDQDILDFIACSPEFRSHNIRAEDLAKLSKSAHFSFLLNGWNEISESNSEKAGVALRKLERSFPAAGIIVATRVHHIIPPLPGAVRAKLLPLTRVQRTDYLQDRLGSRAGELASKLDSDPVLNELTRTCLFLAEVATIFESGRPIPSTKIGVLGQVIRLLEQSEEHSSHLQRHPLKARASEYLEELAAQMTTQGATRVSRQDACAFISCVSRSLRDNGQIETPPDPDNILNALCDHHILERLDYSSDAFSFEHQQFQEFYAAKLLKRQLEDLAQTISLDRNREFAKQYVNDRSWEEPLLMIAEEIGTRSTESQTGSDEVRAGKLLVEMALSIDPIFAAELSRLCGELVWKQVRPAVSERLRSWYEVDDENHQQCALAGMLATGSDEFSDIILPLLTSDDQQVRLSTYRAGAGFYLSSLGAEWQNVVKEWHEEARIDFIDALSSNQWIQPEALESFAIADPSPAVRAEAIPAMAWIGRETTQLLESLSEEVFEEAVQHLAAKNIPASLRPRAIAACQNRLNKLAEAMPRIRILLRLVNLGITDIAEQLKDELIRMRSGKINDWDEMNLKPVLEIVRMTEPEWVSHWVADRVVDGSLWSERWINLVTSISEDLKNKLLEILGDEEVEYNRASSIISVLAATSDANFAEAAFAKLCAVRRNVAITASIGNDAKQAIARQLKDLLHALSPNVAVAGISKCFVNEFDIIEFNAVVEVFSNVCYGDADIRDQLQNDLRQMLRLYLKNSVPFVLSWEDPQGGMKADFAAALARVGDPEDRLDLQQLIRADIDRIRKGQADRKRGEQSALAMGCANRWDTRYIQAVVKLNSDDAEAILLELLKEPEYEGEAALALLRLATIQNTENRLIHKTDYSVVWKAREGQQSREFDEERRERYASAIKQRISVLLEERASTGQTTSYGLKGLAQRLATLDSHHSAELVLQVITLPCESDGWNRVGALEALLFGRGELPTEAALKALNPIIEHSCDRLYDNQQIGLLKKCLCLLPFVDIPSVGIKRMRQVIYESKFPRYELRDVVTALGYSRCHEALALLLELAGADESGLREMFSEWINAVAALGIDESKRVLLSFVDPEVNGFGIPTDVGCRGGDEILVSRIVELARAAPEINQRILQLCDKPLSTQKRALLLKVIAQLGNGNAMLAGLNLIDEAAIPLVPHELRKAMENIFHEYQPQGKMESTYTIVPRSSNEIRARLFEMALKDDRKGQAAFALLGQIEVWRLDYGRPPSTEPEPRHPMVDSGEMWPPIKRNHNLM